MSDFSPIPLDSIKKQFLSYMDSKSTGGSRSQSGGSSNSEPYSGNESCARRSPFKKDVLSSSYNVLGQLNSNDVDFRVKQRLGLAKGDTKTDAKSKREVKHTLYQLDNDSKTSLNIDKEKKILQMAGYSQKLSNSVLDELARKAEQFSSIADDKENCRNSNIPDTVGSIERKFNAIHQKNFSKMDSITNHYSAIRRRKQMQESKRQDSANHAKSTFPRREKRKLSPDIMPRTEVEIDLEDHTKKIGTSTNTSMDISTNLSTKTSFSLAVKADLQSKTNPDLPSKTSPDMSVKTNPDTTIKTHNTSDDVIKTPSRDSKRLSNVQLSSASKRRRTLIGPREVPDSMKSPSAVRHSYKPPTEAILYENDTLPVKNEYILGELSSDHRRQAETLVKPVSEDNTKLMKQSTTKENIQNYLTDDKPIQPLRVRHHTYQQAPTNHTESNSKQPMQNLQSLNNQKQTPQPKSDADNSVRIDISMMRQDVSRMDPFKDSTDNSMMDISMEKVETILPPQPEEQKPKKRSIPSSKPFTNLSNYLSSSKATTAATATTVTAKYSTIKHSSSKSSHFNSSKSLIAAKNTKETKLSAPSSSSSRSTNDGFVKPLNRATTKSHTNLKTERAKALHQAQQSIRQARSNTNLRHSASNESMNKQSSLLTRKLSIPRFCQPTAASLSRQSSRTSLSVTPSSSTTSLNKTGRSISDPIKLTAKSTMRSSTSSSSVRSSKSGAKSLSKAKSNNQMYSSAKNGSKSGFGYTRRE